MRRLASAIFVDFDNLYLSINARSQQAAQAFGTAPQVWLDWLLDTVEMPGFPDNEMKERNFLIRRCYASPRAIQYFRPYYARNAFHVIECQPMTRGGKNTADIYMVMDVLDTLVAYPHIEEFVIFSSDSDFTPVITRLRAHNKRTMIYSTEMTAAAYKAACDDMVVEQDFVDMLLEHAAAHARTYPDQQDNRHVRNGPRPQQQPNSSAPRRITPSPATPQPIIPDLDGQIRQDLIDAIRGLVIGKEEPLPLKDLVDTLLERFGSRIEVSRWAGAGSVTQFLCNQAIENIGLNLNAPAFIYDTDHYTPPQEQDPLPALAAAVQDVSALDDGLTALIARLNTLTNVPDLSPSTYAILFHALVEDIRARPYSLWQTAKSVRDRLLTQGIDVHHRLVFFVLRGIEFSKHRYSAEDTPQLLAAQFRRQVLSLCHTASLELNEQEEALLARWITHDPNATPDMQETLSLEGAIETLADVLPPVTAPACPSFAEEPQGEPAL